MCELPIHMHIFIFIYIYIYINKYVHIYKALGQIFTGEGGHFLTSKQGFLSAVLIRRVMYTFNSILKMLENC